jgi:signal transduction histidine kinase
LFLSACSHESQPEVDKLNDVSYYFHYRDLDSTASYARQAYAQAKDYNYGKAEALNNMAFASMGRMDYARAKEQLDEVTTHTDNYIELLIAEVQQMRLCQRMSRNKDFHDYREHADQCLRRINEERDKLSERQKRRLTYAETEYAIVNSAYYYYVGLEQPSIKALEKIKPDGDIRNDTAQYLNYLYNIGAGGIITKGTQDDIYQQEFNLLAKCLFFAQEHGYKFFVANSLEALAEHLTTHPQGEKLLSANKTTLQFIAPETTDSLMAGWMAENALYLFQSYGDAYQTAAAERTLASCYMDIGDNRSALLHLEKALADTLTEQAPDLVASIREQLSVVYSAINDKASSDHNRNIYLDLQEKTRQDRYLEARADALDNTLTQLNAMITAILLAIALLVFFLWLFYRLNKRRQKQYSTDRLLMPLHQWEKANEQHKEAMRQRLEDMDDKYSKSVMEAEANERRNADNRARVSLANSLLPLIDRISHETEMLVDRKESEEVRADRYRYITELAAKINECNGVLTYWIQMRQGRLSLHIETFPLSPLFAMVAKSSMSFRMKKIELCVAETDAVVKADKVLTLFMLNTLADNARKFTPSGGTVSISAEKKDDCVEISVSDNGCGMEQDELKTVFDRKIYKGHGFGLLNCRGIIDKYHKTSRLFSVCSIGAESTKGVGSRFFFRLPIGTVKTILAFVLGTISLLSVAQTKEDSAFYASQSARFADSAYFSNIDGTYDKTIQFTDSCLKYLNLQYLTKHPDSRIQLHKQGNNALMAPEIKWFHDSTRIDFEVILDIRNETAVAALALHDLPLYEYNNKVYTQLFKEISADNTLADYCRVMQQSQTNKTIAIMICLLVLLLILPAYYFIYYRHILYHRFCMERIDKINSILLGHLPQAKKLEEISRLSHDGYTGELHNVATRIVQTLNDEAEKSRLQAESIEVVADNLHRSEYESNSLYVNNAVLDNCLSSLKHETMYYPSRICQLVDSGDTVLNDLKETVDYYRDLYSLLSRQATLQAKTIKMKVKAIPAKELCNNAPEGLYIIGNRNLLVYMLETIRKQLKGANIIQETCNGIEGNNRYAVITIKAICSHWTDAADGQLFTAKVENVPFLICRQIVRDHSQATMMRGCGMEAMADAGTLTIRIVLPGRKEIH